MQYRKDKKGNDISVIGYGCMRFTKHAGIIDLDKAETEIMEAYNSGINYYDTAYIYPGSEEALGTILKKNNIREKVYIATKLPHYLMKTKEGAERIFNEELKRLKTDYVDYYLMHMLTDIDTWKHLLDIGIGDWIEDKLKSGAIRNIGFSYHGNTQKFKELIDAYDWDFTQIQYNYMDEVSQAGREGLNYAAEKGIPVVIMEPLRGGRLVNLLPSGAKKLFENKSVTPAELAFRWLLDQKKVSCVLSGMNSVEMVKENVKTAELAVPGHFTDSDRELVEAVKTEIERTVKVGCTGCGYCMPCPKGVDIPVTFRCYNEMFSETKGGARKEYLQCTAFRKNQSSASQCIGCGKCETHCPQHIEIRKELKNAVAALETPPYVVARKAIALLKLW
ncbi:MAG: aldo/keto reductase [Lachnospiraceae bacterium]|nr:aldo/keto reductase [Lachnospiraceae bacterium]